MAGFHSVSGIARRSRLGWLKLYFSWFKNQPALENRLIHHRYSIFIIKLTNSQRRFMKILQLNQSLVWITSRIRFWNIRHKFKCQNGSSITKKYFVKSFLDLISYSIVKWMIGIDCKGPKQMSGDRKSVYSVIALHICLGKKIRRFSYPTTCLCRCP